MSDKFKKFNKIEQFRNIVKQVRDYCSYHNEPLPTILFDGTVKLHGTNAAVGIKDGEPVSYTHLTLPTITEV